MPGPGLWCHWRRAPGAQGVRASARGTLHRCKPAVGQGSPDGASLGSSNTRQAAGEKTNAFELEDQALVLGKLKVGNLLQEEKRSVY